MPNDIGMGTWLEAQKIVMQYFDVKAATATVGTCLGGDPRSWGQP
jgi:hypothetical protein